MDEKLVIMVVLAILVMAGGYYYYCNYYKKSTSTTSSFSEIGSKNCVPCQNTIPPYQNRCRTSMCTNTNE